jgi:hypothetical protein
MESTHSTLKIAFNVIFEIMKRLQLRDRLRTLTVIPGAIQAFNLLAPSAFVCKYQMDSFEKLLRWKPTDRQFARKVVGQFNQIQLSRIINVAARGSCWELMPLPTTAMR